MDSTPGYSLLVGGLAAAVSLLLWRFPNMVFMGLALGCVGLIVAIVAFVVSRKSRGWRLGASLVGLALSLFAIAWFPVVQFGALGNRVYSTLELQTRPVTAAERPAETPAVEPRPPETPPEQETSPERDTEPAEGMRRTVDSIAPARQELTEAQRLSTEIADLADELDELDFEVVQERAAELRTAIGELDSETERYSLRRRLDTAIRRALDEQAQPMVETAMQHYANGDLDSAIEASETVMTLYQSDLLSHTPATTPAPLAQAQRVYSAAHHYQTIQSSPVERFRLRGIVGGRDDPVVQLEDRLTGERHRVQRGDWVEDFTVDAVDRSARTVTLRREGQTYLIERR